MARRRFLHCDDLRSTGVRLALVLLLGLAWAPAAVRAQAFEYVAAGTRALGRGGAFAARADDPMALGYNPAALAFLPGYQLMLGSHLAFYDACVQRSGTYDVASPFTTRLGDPAEWMGQPYPRVCRSGDPGPSPQLVFTGHPIPELGFGIGLLAPAGVGNAVWGNPDGTIEVGGRTLPTPTRYALVESDLLLFHPTIGIGFSPIRELSFGVSFQWGIAIVDFTNHTSAGNGVEDPALDVHTVLHSEDFFVPAVIFSVHVVPIDELDIVATARFSDGIDGGGTLDLTTGWYGDETSTYLPQHTRLTNVRLQAGQPWQFGLALRYAQRRERRYRDPEQAGRITGRVEDHMQNEVWDVELDLVYHHNGQIRDFVVTPPDDARVSLCEGPRRPDGSCNIEFQAPLPGALALPHGWGDQFSVRLGGDWNVLPGQLALRAGAHFITSGLNSKYQIQDFLPGMRLGLHLGATLRIDRFDVSIAYAHIFQFDETITDGNFRAVAAQGTDGLCGDGGEYDPERPVPSRGCYPAGYGAVVNAGTYSAEYNVLSLQVSYNFQ